MTTSSLTRKGQGWGRLCAQDCELLRWGVVGRLLVKVQGKKVKVQGKKINPSNNSTQLIHQKSEDAILVFRVTLGSSQACGRDKLIDGIVPRRLAACQTLPSAVVSSVQPAALCLMFNVSCCVVGGLGFRVQGLGF